MPPQLLLIVAAALIRADGRILVQRRAPGRAMAGLWEFPGGKIEPDEAPEAALVRELAEELGVTVAPGALVPVSFASAPLGDRSLVLLLFEARRWTGEPRPLDAAELSWARVDELRQLPMPPADLPLVEVLARMEATRSG